MIANLITIIFLLVGLFFLIVVVIGLFRLPDVLSRLHISSKCDTLGTISILVASAIYIGWSYDILRLVTIGFLLTITSVTSSHAIGRSVLKMKPGDFKGEPSMPNPGSREKNVPDT